MKVIIAGSRTFNDYKLLYDSCEKALSNSNNIEIVSGTANGADKLGERYANEKGYKVTQFPADWTNHGKRAGYLRNNQMAVYADALIAFWDYKSKGTGHMIDLAKANNIKVIVINTNQ